MYLPPRFAAPSEAAIERVLHEHPLATVITPMGDDCLVSHLPLVLEKRGEERFLLGHLARVNPHTSALDGREALVIFHGPEAYVTPLWYEDGDVPTWNYLVAHLRGRPRLLESEEETIRVVRALSDRMEGEAGWRFEVPEDLSGPGRLLRAIVGFEIPVRSMEGKFKLSQNRSERDFGLVAEGLARRGDERSRQVADWMGRI